MIPLIIEGDNVEKINLFLSDHYYLSNLVSEVMPTDNSIGLPAIKYLIDRAKFTHPDKSLAVFLIRDSHLITREGQNALLKTLEESKNWQQFILTTHNHHLLLETIISRSQIKSLFVPTSYEFRPDSLKNFVNMIKNPSQIIANTDKIQLDNPRAFLTQFIDQIRLANRILPTKKRIKIIRFALECSFDLDRNINPKLAIDHFLLKSGKLLANSLK